MSLAKIKEYRDSGKRDSHFLKENEKMIAHFKSIVTDKIEVTGETVIDFGCGGGLLGLLLLGVGAKRYIGYDISSLAVEMAKKNLHGYKNTEFVLSTGYPWGFADKKPDIFISLACSIHFPDKKYLDNWLDEIEICGAKKLIIEIRDTGKGTAFDDIPCRGKFKTRIVCLTDEKYVTARLPGYRLIHKTDPKVNQINCQFLWFGKRR